MRIPMNELTKEDWTEIYYALDTKAAMITRGEYAGETHETRRWAAHLRKIMEKIGPDGENMT